MDSRARGNERRVCERADAPTKARARQARRLNERAATLAQSRLWENAPLLAPQRHAVKEYFPRHRGLQNPRSQPMLQRRTWASRMREMTVREANQNFSQ